MKRARTIAGAGVLLVVPPPDTDAHRSGREQGCSACCQKPGADGLCARCEWARLKTQQSFRNPGRPAADPGTGQQSQPLGSAALQSAAREQAWHESGLTRLFYRTGSGARPAMAQQTGASGTKSGRFNQTDLVASGGELAALIALHDNTTPGFDADHPGTHPAKSGRLQHLDNITGLQIQLHLRKHENGEQGSSNAPWRT